MSNRPLVRRVDNNIVQLYSGKSQDSIPFLSVSANDKYVSFQIPGGGKLEVPFHVAVKFGLEIIDVSTNLIIDVFSQLGLEDSELNES